DMRERRLAETRRPEQQYVIERFGAPLGRFDEDFELTARLFLPDVLVELVRAQRALERFFVRRDGRSRDDAFGGEFIGFDHGSIVQLGFSRGIGRMGQAVTPSKVPSAPA